MSDKETIRGGEQRPRVHPERAPADPARTPPPKGRRASTRS